MGCSSSNEDKIGCCSYESINVDEKYKQTTATTKEEIGNDKNIQNFDKDGDLKDDNIDINDDKKYSNPKDNVNKTYKQTTATTKEEIGNDKNIQNFDKDGDLKDDNIDINDDKKYSNPKDNVNKTYKQTNPTKKEEIDKDINYSNPKDIIDIEKIKNYIKTMPSREELTLSETVEHLKSIIKENNLIQEEIAFLSFCWMAENVTYAHEEKRNGIKVDCSVEGMYKNGKSVCSGFSRLYNHLTTNLGIETVNISGYAKGSGYVPGESYHSNHDWNAIKLRNKWYLLDITWGEGYSNHNKYVKEFNPFYFCTPPKYFIYQHFPNEEKWQLLDKPISEKEYIDMINYKHNFFTYGFTEIIPNKSVVNINNNEYNMKVYFEKNENLRLKINLYFENNKDENIGKENCIVDKKDNYFDVIFNLPQKGLYNVRLYGSNSENKYHIKYNDIAKFIIEYN